MPALFLTAIYFFDPQLNIQRVISMGQSLCRTKKIVVRLYDKLDRV